MQKVVSVVIFTLNDGINNDITNKGYSVIEYPELDAMLKEGYVVKNYFMSNPESKDLRVATMTLILEKS